MNLDLPERYELDADPLLGEGGMGRVLRARDRFLDVPVALKVVRPDLAARPRFARLFDLEVRMSARFSHPHIVPLHDHGITPGGTPWLGLAYAGAGSFAAFRKEAPDWDELQRLLLQLIGALSHLHARGVLHRDLKPENVLLHEDAGGRMVWLADLGLANAALDLARGKGRTEGTPGFMAPEQRLGLPREYGPWTDLYALGVMVWEIVTGERPFADNQTSQDAELPSFRPRPGVAVPEDLPTLLANLLSPEPMSRYDLAADLRTELLALGPPVLFDDASRSWTVGGTVAPSAVSSISIAETEEGPDRSDVFVRERPDDRRGDPNVPVWNRPIPPEIPIEAPPESTGSANARASLGLFALQDMPLVGRSAERQILWSHARGVIASRRPKVVLVIGEAGAGKERLVESVVHPLEEGGWAECLRLSWQRPPGADDGYAGAARGLLRPWNETRASLTARLRRRLARERAMYDASIRAEADTLARWCGLLLEDEEPVAAGLGLREIRRHLEARAWRGLGCLILSDASWASDEGDGLAIAEALLAADAEGTTDDPILAIATLRSEEIAADPVLADRVAALEAAGATVVHLPRLDLEQTRTLVRESLRLAPHLADQVAARCEGNPLFARQLLLEWSARGWLVDVGGLTFDLAPGVHADDVLPADAAALFDDRIARLGELSGSPKRFFDLVHMAALAGRAIPHALLVDLAGEQIAEFAVSCGLWVARDDRMEFDSSMLHQAMASRASERRDVAYLHRRLGKAWARVATDAGSEFALATGRHALLGHDHELAMSKLLDGAALAWRRGRTVDLEEASRLVYDLVQQDRSLRSRWGDAAMYRGRALQMAGDAARAGAAYEEATTAYRSDGAGSLEVEAICGQGWSWLAQGQLERAEEAYATAIARARAVSDPLGEARAVAGKAWLEQQKRNFEGADILFTRAVTRLGTLGDARALGDATLGQAFVARRTGAFDDAASLYDESGDAYRDADDPLGEARASLGRGMLLRQQGSEEAAESVLREALEDTEELGAMQLLMEIRLALADLYRGRHELDRAARIYEEHLGWADRSRAFESRVLAGLGLAWIALERGDIPGAQAQCAEVATVLERVPGHWLWATYRLTVATALAERGELKSTWEWLWSADELGLRDTVDRDAFALLERIFEVSDRPGWDAVRRLTAKLLLPQAERLGRADRVRALEPLVPRA